MPTHSTRLAALYVSTTIALLAACGDDDSPTTPTNDPAPPIDVTYGFKSGSLRGDFDGDGFQWPLSPPGMIDDFPSSTFTTPDGVRFFHDIGNNLFFDAAYLLPDETAAGTGIDEEAMWGQPRPIGFPIVESINIQFDAPVHYIGFDIAWAIGGETAPDVVELGLGEDLGGDEIIAVGLTNSFDAGAVFQNSLGYSGRVELTVADLAAIYELDFSGIRHLTIFVDGVSTKGPGGAFAVDNFTAVTTVE